MGRGGAGTRRGGETHLQGARQAVALSQLPLVEFFLEMDSAHTLELRVLPPTLESLPDPWEW